MKPRTKYTVIILIVSVCLGGLVIRTKNRLLPPDVELAGQAIGQAQLNELTAETGIRFPPGTIGINYLYAAVRDPAIYAKLKIPQARRAEFMKNSIFSNKTADGAYFLDLREKEWWRPGDLKNVKKGWASLPGPAFAECIAGEQGGDFIIYVAWMRP